MDKNPNNNPNSAKFGLIITFLSLVSGLLVLTLNNGPETVGRLEILIYLGLSFFFLLGLVLMIFRQTQMVNTFEQKTAKWQTTLTGPLLGLFTIILSFLILEIISRSIIAANPAYRLHNNNARLSYAIESPAYADASFATEAFFQERFNPQNAIVTFDDTGTYILPQNFDGEWINVINHHRQTTGQPENYDHIVYLFGGSTLFNVEVPDDQTVASKLQALLSDSYGEMYKVVNLGVIGASTSQQLAHLKTLALEQGDVVIFFDGINDVVKNLSYRGSRLTRILEKSHLIKYFILPVFQRWLPGYQLGQADIEATYIENITTAYNLSQKAGAHFLHFLQPNIYMDESPTVYESTLITSLENDYPGWKKSILQGYEQLASAQQKLSTAGLPSYDWRYLLIDHEINDPHEIFLDDVHVNHIGNQIIAEALFASIKDHLE